MDLNKLDEPFAPQDIEWRIQQSGKSGSGKLYAMVLAYVTNRAIMARLDDVCGKANWRNEYQPAPAGGVMCGISIKVDGEWITKWDAAENTQVEAVKGGMSGAMKRAAVQWGIGRYLYNLEEGFAQTSDQKRNDWNRAKLKDGTTFWWLPPQLPVWALPPVTEQGGQSANSEPEAPARTPDDILRKFTEMVSQESDLETIKGLYKAAWNALASSPDDQKKCVEVYQIRAKELNKAA
ncbi:recombinase [Pantoea dispersa]|uniref:Rad52/Rad22 family DNA repair protein n=1 Tax=Pantoea dispersa TaxID=59814 RepID=UPI000F663BFA|nr:Rad52/Rad22 family DNA repair protein [Pantoea dispersa]RRW77657.1 recombinase [Pantoea dispersa]